MEKTYSQIYIHVVFAVNGCDNFITENMREEIQKFISGIIAHHDQKLYAIYCMPDHTHVLISIKPECIISDFVRDIKANSSRFINEKKWFKQKFSWQTGYGAFTYAYSQLQSVVKYIIDQPQYHQHKPFREEFIETLERFEVDYKTEYLFEFYD